MCGLEKAHNSASSALYLYMQSRCSRLGCGKGGINGERRIDMRRVMRTKRIRCMPAVATGKEGGGEQEDRCA